MRKVRVAPQTWHPFLRVVLQLRCQIATMVDILIQSKFPHIPSLTHNQRVLSQVRLRRLGRRVHRLTAEKQATKHGGRLSHFLIIFRIKHLIYVNCRLPVTEKMLVAKVGIMSAMAAEGVNHLTAAVDLQDRQWGEQWARRSTFSSRKSPSRLWLTMKKTLATGMMRQARNNSWHDLYLIVYVMKSEKKLNRQFCGRSPCAACAAILWLIHEKSSCKANSYLQ